MKKFIKISSVAAVIAALVLNFHSAILSFYGVETNSALAASVWGQATSTGNTGGDGDGSSGWGYQWFAAGCNKQETISMTISYTGSGNGGITVYGQGGTVTGATVQGGGTVHSETQQVVLVTSASYQKCDRTTSSGGCHWWNEEDEDDCAYPAGRYPYMMTYTSTSGSPITTNLHWSTSN